jgi:hypothetical protein
MAGAGEALAAAAAAALTGVEELGGVYAGPPVQAAYPYAVVEAGPESDWSHKSGTGRELRLAAILRDKGESPARLRRIAARAEAALAALEGDVGGWHVVNLRFLRFATTPPRTSASGESRTGEPWLGLVEFRARMLKA